MIQVQDRADMAQNTQEWQLHRLGKFTASRIAELISAKPQLTKTAISYINEVTAERMLKEEYVEDYIAMKDRQSFAMQWGHEQEPIARREFAAMMGWDVKEVGTYTHKEHNYFMASPDGVVPDLDVIVEFKCPQAKNFVTLSVGLRNGTPLKELDATYYWQVQAQLACTGATRCAFVVYSPMFKTELSWAFVERNEADIQLMMERVTAAEALVKANIETLTDAF